MIISKNTRQVQEDQRQAQILADTVNRHLEEFAATGLPQVQPGELQEFIKNPFTIFKTRMEQMAKDKNMEGADPVEFARLYKISYNPNLTKDRMEPSYAAFVTLKKGVVKVVDDIKERLEERYTLEVIEEGQEAAAKLLLETFVNFTYLATLLSSGGTGNVHVAGMHHFGFSLMNPGHLTKDVVQRIADGMKKVSRDEFKQRLQSQFGNPGLKGG